MRGAEAPVSGSSVCDPEMAKSERRGKTRKETKWLKGKLHLPYRSEES